MSWVAVVLLVGGVTLSLLGIAASIVGLVGAFRNKKRLPDSYDEEGEDNEESRRSRGPRREPRPAPSSKAGCGNIALIIGGVLALAFGLLVVCAGIGSVAQFSYLETAKEQAAAITVHKIEAAVSEYRINHGVYPATLQELTVSEQGKQRLLEPADLIDPWGNPFIYEPQRLNATGRPRISTQTPSGEKIANW